MVAMKKSSVLKRVDRRPSCSASIAEAREASAATVLLGVKLGERGMDLVMTLARGGAGSIIRGPRFAWAGAGGHAVIAAADARRAANVIAGYGTIGRGADRRRADVLAVRDPLVAKWRPLAPSSGANQTTIE